MNKKPPQGDDSVAEFNPNQHWRSFEYLSLEVLSVVLEKENLPCQIIKRDVTKETRDCGVDGFIRFRVSDSDQSTYFPFFLAIILAHLKHIYKLIY